MATSIIGLIVISFMFTGYNTTQGTPDTVATVGDLPVKFDEYQREYSNQINFYKRLFGGKDLTKQQIEQFDIKNAAIRNIVQRKLMLKLADEMGASPSQQEIKTEIKNLPYFQVNKQFSVEQYKRILSYNKIDVKVFESDIANQLKDKIAREVINNFPVSNGYMNAIQSFKDNKVSASIVQFSGNTFQTHLKVSRKDMADYLADPNNVGRVKSIFKERKPTLDKLKKIHSSHILVKEEKLALELLKKAKRSNFSRLAKKHSTEPNAKKSGGKLPPFTKGRMVPAFEKLAFTMKPGEIKGPVKTQFGYHVIYVHKVEKEVLAAYKDHEAKIAKELIQKQMTPQLNARNKAMETKLAKLMKIRSNKKIESLAKKYNFTFNRSVTIDPFDGASGNAAITPEDMALIFAKGLGQRDTYTFNSSGNITVVRTYPYKKKKSDTANLDPEKDKNGLKQVFSRKVTQMALKEIQKNVKVKVFDNLIQR
mgnify:CR=1 FL=1